ncbi:MAG: hypothetical protein AAGE94_15465 [Acidobacteriota bacterium]
MLGLLVGLLGWSLLQGARVAYRVLWYGIADPMPIEAPVIWSVDTGHARRLAAFAGRLDVCLPPGSSMAIDPSAVGLAPDQSFFWSLWLAHFLPAHDVRPARPGADFRSGADFWLTAETTAVPAESVACRIDRFALVALDTRSEP